MQDFNVTPLYSTDLHLLQSLFMSLNKPCGLEEIRQFNRLYREIYPRLSQYEKRRSEALVDTLIENLEDQGLAARIYGVV